MQLAQRSSLPRPYCPSRWSRSAPCTSRCSRPPSGSRAAASRRPSSSGSPTACTGSRPCPRGSRGRAACGSAASACGCRRRTPRENSLRVCVDAREVLLVRRLLVRVGRRDLHRVDLELVVQEVEHLAHGLRRVGREERRVGGDAETARLRLLDRLDGQVEDPSRSTNWSWRSRMPSRWTTQAKYGDGLKWSSFFFIRIAFVQRKTNFLRLISSLRDHVHLGVHERLAARDRHHRRAALLDRRERLLDRHPLLEDVLRVLDLPAERAGEIALEERLQLDQQRELLVTLDLLLGEITARPELLAERHGHQRHLLRQIELDRLLRDGSLFDHRPARARRARRLPAGRAARVRRRRRSARSYAFRRARRGRNRRCIVDQMRRCALLARPPRPGAPSWTSSPSRRRARRPTRAPRPARPAGGSGSRNRCRRSSAPPAPGNACAERSTTSLGLVDGEGRLREVRHLRRDRSISSPVEVVEVLDEPDRAGRLAHGALDLLVTAVADEEDRLSAPRRSGAPRRAPC